MNQDLPKCSVPGWPSKLPRTKIVWAWNVQGALSLCHLLMAVGAIVNPSQKCLGMYHTGITLVALLGLMWKRDPGPIEVISG